MTVFKSERETRLALMGKTRINKLPSMRCEAMEETSTIPHASSTLQLKAREEIELSSMNFVEMYSAWFNYFIFYVFYSRSPKCK